MDLVSNLSIGVYIIMDTWKQARIADVGFAFELTVGKRLVSSVIPVVTLNGEQFDLYDLYKALVGVQAGDTYITAPRMCKHLLELDVLTACGSRRTGAAYKGPRFDELLKRVEELRNEE